MVGGYVGRRGVCTRIAHTPTGIDGAYHNVYSERMSTTDGTQFPAIHGLLLRLSFTPDAIREHFEGDPISDHLDTLTDDALAQIGFDALTDDRLYEVFHQVLTDAATAYLAPDYLDPTG